MSTPSAVSETLVGTEQMTHTPGPWKARALKNGNVIVFAELSQLALGICHILFTNGQPHENARLIAAAPDLLAALKLASAIVEDLAASAEDYAVARAARAAIDKVEGAAS